MKTKLLILACLLFAAWWYFGKPYQGWVIYENGIYRTSVPIQNNLKNQTSFDFKGYELTAVADFEVKARLLGKKAYLRLIQPFQSSFFLFGVRGVGKRCSACPTC